MTIDRLYKEFGDDFCLSPFVEIFLNTQGNDQKWKLRPCCQWKKEINGENHESIIDVYNNNEFKKLRKMHANGNGLQHTLCQVCKNDESNYSTSIRLANNIHLTDQFNYDWVEMIQNIIKNDYQIKDIIVVGFMPNNYCDFACIMCTGAASSSRALIEGHAYSRLDEVQPVDLHSIIDNTKLLNFTGGETLIQPTVINLINKLVDTNQSSHINVGILTNLGKYNYSLYSKLEQFNQCCITFSIDGIGKIFEYQRRNGNWNKVEENYKNVIKNHPRLNHMINYVVTAISITGITDFIRWAYDNNEQDVNFTLVQDQLHLSINGLDALMIDTLRMQVNQLRNELTYKSTLGAFDNIFKKVDNIFDSYKFDLAIQENLIVKMKKEDEYWKNIKLIDIIPEFTTKYNSI